jgi:hypothetical protein
VTCTAEPVNLPDRTPSGDAVPLGDVGDDEPSPQAAKSVASVAPDATWHAPAQNWRRETGVFVSDIAIEMRGQPEPVGNIETTRTTTRGFMHRRHVADCRGLQTTASAADFVTARLDGATGE